MDTCPFLGPLKPLFWTSADVSSGQPALGGGIRGVCSQRLACGVTPLLVYMASIAASHFPYMRVLAEPDWNGRPLA